MKEDEYLNDPVIKEFLKFLVGESKNISHSYTYKGNDRRKGQEWSSKGLIQASHSFSLNENFKGYWWNFNCLIQQDNKATYELASGYTLEESNDALKSLSQKLDTALKEKSPIDVLIACQEILCWGGVFDKWNRKRLYDAASSDICGRLLTIKKALEEPDIDDKEIGEIIKSNLWMNSGFTKIYSCLTDDFVIYDGRVGAALGILVREFYASEGGKVSQGTVHDLLNFPWGDGKSGEKKRDPSCGSLTFQKLNSADPIRHSIWNIRANWLLKCLSNELNTSSQKNVGSLRQIEAALFMIGYDVSGKCSPVNQGPDFDDSRSISKSPRKTLKIDCAKEVYKKSKRMGRQKIIGLFQSECDLTPSAASTYYQKIKSLLE